MLEISLKQVFKDPTRLISCTWKNKIIWSCLEVEKQIYSKEKIRNTTVWSIVDQKPVIYSQPIIIHVNKPHLQHTVGSKTAPFVAVSSCSFCCLLFTLCYLASRQVLGKQMHFGTDDFQVTRHFASKKKDVISNNFHTPSSNLNKS